MRFCLRCSNSRFCRRSTMGKVPFSLTYVTYDESDPLGFAMALITLSPM